ncbi:MAG TPA: WD40 repeat domain-containing protein, partial [Thermoanaerobaculia bacterium]
WSRDGREVFFTGAREGAAISLHAVSLSGRERDLLATPAPMAVLDIAPDGSVLLEQRVTNMRITGLAPGEIRERDLSWLDYSSVCDLSPDGRRLVFDESGAGVGWKYRAYLGTTDGAPPIRLSDGTCGGLSFDGQWIASRSIEPAGIFLVPTRSGEPKPLSVEGLSLHGASFFPKDDRLLLGASEPGRAMRFFVKDEASGRWRPISPEVAPIRASKPISPDGEWVFANGLDGKPYLYPIGKGEARPLPAVQPGDRPFQWTPNSRGIFVMSREGASFRIYRIELATGDRALWKEIAPPDPAGFVGITSFFFADDARSYVYSYQRIMADLYLVSALE